MSIALPFIVSRDVVVEELAVDDDAAFSAEARIDIYGRLHPVVGVASICRLFRQDEIEGICGAFVVGLERSGASVHAYQRHALHGIERAPRLRLNPEVGIG